MALVLLFSLALMALVRFEPLPLMALGSRGKARQKVQDRVDDFVREWHERRPDLDFSPLEVVSRVLRAAHYLQARLDGIAAAYGLSHTGDLDVLTNLEGPGVPMRERRRNWPRYNRSPQEGMTVRLNRLQRTGLIERRPNPRDGRGVLVRLTPMGQQLTEDALATLIKAQAASIQGFDESKQAVLVALLRDLLITLGDIPAFRPSIDLRLD